MCTASEQQESLIFLTISNSSIVDIPEDIMTSTSANLMALRSSVFVTSPDAILIISTPVSLSSFNDFTLNGEIINFNKDLALL